MARKGSRAMMNDDESGVVELPRPAPICCVRDLAMPKLATLGVCVRSGNCAPAGTPCDERTNPTIPNRIRITADFDRCVSFMSGLPYSRTNSVDIIELPLHAQGKSNGNSVNPPQTRKTAGITVAVELK